MYNKSSARCPIHASIFIKSKKVKQLLECLYHYSWLPSSYCIRVMSFVNKCMSCTFFKKSSETSGVSPISHSSFVLRTTYIYMYILHILHVHIYLYTSINAFYSSCHVCHGCVLHTLQLSFNCVPNVHAHETPALFHANYHLDPIVLKWNT